MSQSDFTLPGGAGYGGLSMRQDVQAALRALASSNSGAATAGSNRPAAGRLVVAYRCERRQ